MKFQIDDWNMDKLPKGLNAKREDLTYLDYRTVPTLEEAKEHI